LGKGLAISSSTVNGFALGAAWQAASGELTRVHLTGREHVISGVRMLLVVSRMELAGVVLGGRRVGKVVRKDRLSFGGVEVRFDVRIVIGRTWPTDVARYSVS
jgi:hypothetical protein